MSWQKEMSRGIIQKPMPVVSLWGYTGIYFKRRSFVQVCLALIISL
jgi:hypothetical protein